MSNDLCRRSRVRKLVVWGACLAAVLSAPAFSCHGAMSWKFLPLDKARIQVAKLEAEALARRKTLFAEPSAELAAWEKYYDNPIFKPGLPGSWEEKSVDCFTIGFFDGRYMLWYDGTPNDLHTQIGLATSPDGIHWERDPGNPILRTGPPGSWDSSLLICQDVLFDDRDGFYKMWYVGGKADANEAVFGIGYAASPDGARWQKYAGNPVLTVTEEWEGTVIEGHSVRKIGSTFFMWYAGLALGSDVSYIGLAISRDGIHWTKHRDNPIFKPDVAPGAWDGYSVDTCDITVEKDVLHMWYRGWRRRGGVSWIGHATSKDGIRWERDAVNPIILPAAIPGAWDTYQLYRPRLLPGKGAKGSPQPGVDWLLYSGRNYTLKSQVGLALRVHPFQKVVREPRDKFPHFDQDNLGLVIEPSTTGRTELYYFTPWLSKVSVRIYDGSGRKVRTLVQEVKLPGFYQTAWNGRDDLGNPLPPGFYYGEIRTEDYLLSKGFVVPGK
jgi:hypothetical protein